MESTLKGKNLLLQEQIPSFKSWPLLRREAKNSRFASSDSISITLVLFNRGISAVAALNAPFKEIQRFGAFNRTNKENDLQLQKI